MGCLGEGRRESKPTLCLQHLHACDPETAIRWQAVDKHVPLHASHKAILQKVAALYGAFY